MQDLTGKTAVVTGAANGIGFALAEHCIDEGMHVALADVEQGALEKAAEVLSEKGGSVVPVVTDVSKVADVERLRDRVFEALGAVHLLCNNAGVGAGGTVWESSLADWKWVMGVNLWGVIHACRIFLPAMLEQNVEGHIVNTASLAGVLPYHLSASYQVTKHAVVALSENLYHSLAQRDARVKVSVLCPGFVKTRILSSGRNRPVELRDGAAGPVSRADEEALWEDIGNQYSVIEPTEVAGRVFEAIRQEQFWIYTHGSEFDDRLKARVESMIEGKNPEVVILKLD